MARRRQARPRKKTRRPALVYTGTEQTIDLSPKFVSTLFPDEQTLRPANPPIPPLGGMGQTPDPNPTGWRDDYYAFRRALDIKVEDGAVRYGNKSFTLPVLSTLDEIEAEMLDICGWSFILWCRLQGIKKAIR
jgi:hypothetical protein